MTSIIEIIKLVIKNMFEKKGRVFLTISGIIIGIFTFVFFIFVAQGLTNAITQQFSSFGLNAIGVMPAGAQVTMGPPGGSGLTDTDIAKIRQVIKDYKYIAPGIFYQGLYEYGREKTVIMTVGYHDDNLDDVSDELGIVMDSGRMLRPNDKGVVVLGYKTANNAFGKEITVGNSIKTGERSLRVIGIIEERGDLFIDSSMLMPFDDIKLISGQDTYSTIRISFYDNVDIDEMGEAIDRKLNLRGKEKHVNITTPTQVLEQFNQIIGLLGGIISFISSIALIVGGINVMNTMYSNVLERINEISLMKAIGATNSDIRNLFLIESSVLGLIGALIGFMLAYLLAQVASMMIAGFGYDVPIYFDYSLFFIVIFVTAFIAMLFGTYPALKAAKINPADNLKDE